MIRLSLAAAAYLVLSMIGGAAQAQAYPDHVVKLIVGNSAGTLPDIIARIIAPGISQNLGQPVIVENKPGADQLIAYQTVANGPADGYTIVLGSPSQLASLPILVKQISFDPSKDVPAVVGLVEGRYAFMVPAASGWKSLSEVVAAAKAQPGKLNYGAATVPTRLLTEAVLHKDNLNVAYIPYKGSADYLLAMIKSEISMGVAGETNAMTQKEGIRVLAVSGRSSPYYPDAPTFASLGYDIPTFSFSLNVRAGTPKEIRDRIYSATSRTLQMPDVKEKLGAAQLDVMVDLSPEYAEKQLADQTKLYSEMAKLVGIEAR